MKRILLGVVGVVVLALVGGAAAVFLGHVPLPFLAHRVGRQPSRPRPASPSVSVSVPTITTNLGDAGATHFAQVALTISLSGPAAAKAFNARVAAVEDAVITDLRERSAAQLDAADGMTGLRTAITASVDQVIGDPAAVRAVYFTQFVVQ